jgi:hypothetical protein
MKRDMRMMNEAQEPFSAEYEAQQRPLDKIARFDAPKFWSWNGDATVELSNRVVTGPTTFEIIGPVIQGKTAWRTTQPNIVDTFANYNPGKMVSIRDLGSARPSPDVKRE